jgi:hypothetical protein
MSCQIEALLLGDLRSSAVSEQPIYNFEVSNVGGLGSDVEVNCACGNVEDTVISKVFENVKVSSDSCDETRFAKVRAIAIGNSASSLVKPPERLELSSLAGLLYSVAAT